SPGFNCLDGSSRDTIRSHPRFRPPLPLRIHGQPRFVLIWFAELINWLFCSAVVFLPDRVTLLINDVKEVQAVAVSEALIAASASCSLLTKLFSTGGDRLKLRTSAIRSLI